MKTNLPADRADEAMVVTTEIATTHAPVAQEKPLTMIVTTEAAATQVPKIESKEKSAPSSRKRTFAEMTLNDDQ